MAVKDYNPDGSSQYSVLIYSLLIAPRGIPLFQFALLPYLILLLMAKKKAKRDPIDFENRVLTRGDLTRRDGFGRFVFLGIEETAIELGIAKSEVLTWIKTGSVPHFVIDGRVLFHRSELPGYESQED